MSRYLPLIALLFILPLLAQAQVSGPVQHREFPACVDTGGNHLNYDSSAGTFACGTSGGGSGAVSTTGTPAAGNLTKFSAAATITSTDLTGDCTTSGTTATSCTTFNAGTSYGSAAGAASGTSGHTLPFLDGNNVWSGSSLSAMNVQTGTTYTLAATDCGKTIKITNASAITVTTLNALVAGCYINIIQGGAGQITVTSGSGATLQSPHSYSKTFGQYALIGLFVDANSGGSSAEIVLYGDGA